MIEFILAYLNDFEIFACNIGNGYLNDKRREKIWTEAGTQFGTEKGIVIIIEIELYGLKSSGAARREKLEDLFKLIGYKSSVVDTDVWKKWDFNPNVDPYYKYMLFYIDDLIHICFNPK